MKFESFIKPLKTWAKLEAEEKNLKLTSAQHSVANELGFPDWQKLDYNLKKLHQITENIIKDAEDTTIIWEEDLTGKEITIKKGKEGTFAGLSWSTLGGVLFILDNLNLNYEDNPIKKRNNKVNLNLLVSIEEKGKDKLIVEDKIEINLNDSIEISVQKIQKHFFSAYGKIIPKFNKYYKKYGWYKFNYEGQETIGYYFEEDAGNIKNPGDLDFIIPCFKLLNKDGDNFDNTTIGKNWSYIIGPHNDPKLNNLICDNKNLVKNNNL